MDMINKHFSKTIRKLQNENLKVQQTFKQMFLKNTPFYVQILDNIFVVSSNVERQILLSTTY